MSERAIFRPIGSLVRKVRESWARGEQKRIATERAIRCIVVAQRKVLGADLEGPRFAEDSWIPDPDAERPGMVRGRLDGQEVDLGIARADGTAFIIPYEEIR